MGAKDAFAPRQKAQGSKRMAAAVDRLRANVAGEEPQSSTNGGKRKRGSRRNAARTAEDEEDGEEDGEQEEEQTTSKGRGKRAKAS